MNSYTMSLLGVKQQKSLHGMHFSQGVSLGHNVLKIIKKEALSSIVWYRTMNVYLRLQDIPLL